MFDVALLLFIYIIYKCWLRHWLTGDRRLLFSLLLLPQQLILWYVCVACARYEQKLYYPQHVKTYFLIMGVVQNQAINQTESKMAGPSYARTRVSRQLLFTLMKYYRTYTHTRTQRHTFSFQALQIRMPLSNGGIIILGKTSSSSFSTSWKLCA